MAIAVEKSEYTETPSWHRWYRRTNVHIAEYILMLILVGTLGGLLSALWFEFFQLLVKDGYEASRLAESVAEQLGALFVLAPFAYLMYSRVSGQEMVQPEIRRRTSRTVFLTLWLLPAVLTLLGFFYAIPVSIIDAIFGFSRDSASELIVGVAIPAVFAIATFAFVIYMVVKAATRKFSMIAGIVLASITFILLVACGITAAIKHESSSDNEKCYGTRMTTGSCRYTSPYRTNYYNNSYDYDNYY